MFELGFVPGQSYTQKKKDKEKKENK